MPLLKVQGIVLKQINIGEADKIITLFTDKKGKVQAVVHGARKAKSKFMSSTQPFSYCEYVLYKGRNLYTVNQSEVKESFQAVLNDLYSLTYSTYFMELVDVLTQEEESNIELFGLLLKSLHLMTEKQYDKELLVRAFEIKAMVISGYMPDLNKCSVCSSDRYSEMRFSSRLGGIVCGDCSHEDRYSIKTDPSTVNILKYLIKTDIGRIHTVKVSPTIKNEMKKILKNYTKYYLEREFRSLEFLEELKNIDSIKEM